MEEGHTVALEESAAAAAVVESPKTASTAPAVKVKHPLKLELKKSMKDAISFESRKLNKRMKKLKSNVESTPATEAATTSTSDSGTNPNIILEKQLQKAKQLEKLEQQYNKLNVPIRI